ncbi:hypothetical protein [Stenotrophomonas sp. SORGH_AS_0282]|uniref:hypothetical protein n=1 Tax=Stenotrophomonas sp. SORGH_AS_0282 TaxID=3041763 RepID=UPI002785AACB|nr:hypothetical protein [Stenotrophomonas sp. SORGH_AS_0282]MDQ1061693.1 hypothetical protein [Stenotrophomonas sp. SORGH_AS_0282]MDQ1189956.1 hypothetical protein [Stenotrophomonas sp. SORGH_AS_0282]
MLSHLSQLVAVELHDAVVGDVVLSIEDRSVEVSVKLPDSGESQGELHRSCLFKEVGNCLVRLDFSALAEESWAGNVQNCRLDVDAGVARFYLAGGLIECSSRSLALGDKGALASLNVGEGCAALPDSLTGLGELDFDESQLLKMTMSPGSCSCHVIVMVRGRSKAAPRVQARITFHDVSSCLATVAMSSLSSQDECGNIQSCQVDSNRGIVRLYLRDGFIEVVAKSVALTHR